MSCWRTAGTVNRPRQLSVRHVAVRSSRDVVWAELGAWYESASRMQSDMDDLGVAFSPMSAESASLAGSAWARYRQAGGQRSRVIADFLIAAHASLQADVLVSRDRGFHRRYFEGLTVIAPRPRS